MLRIVTPQGLQERDREREVQLKNEAMQGRQDLTALGSHLRKLWIAAYTARNTNGIDERLMQCRRQRSGEYDPKQLAAIQKEGGSEVFMMLTNVKCRAAAAWIRDVLLPPGDKPWSIEPTPVPDLPEDKMQEIIDSVRLEAASIMQAQGIMSLTPENIQSRLEEMISKIRKENEERATMASQRFELRIQDQFIEGGYYKALSEFIEDIVTYPVAYIAGPEVRRKKVLVWEKRQEEWIPVVSEKFVREYRCPSPFDIFPAPASKYIQDGFLFERHRLRRADLLDMRGVPGFNDIAIMSAVKEYGTKGHHEWLSFDQERADLESRDQDWEDPDPPIDALQFWGSVQGTMLREWGMSSEKVPEALGEYQITAWMIDRHVICARLNPHPLGTKPYYSASYELVNGSVYGKSPPELMRDSQRICNGAARALVNNVGIASGPQVEVNKSRLEAGEDYERMWPWKIWKTKDDRYGHGKPAIQFYQPEPLVDMLLKVFDYFFRNASEESGIPAYIYGNETSGSGAGQTATGLSMLMNAASKSLKAVISHIDEGVIKHTVYQHWIHVMLYDKSEMKSGDINVIARASEYLLMQEQYQLRRLEFLKFTNNPLDAPIIGMRGRATILREVAKSLKLPQNIVPDDDTFETMTEGGGGPVPPGGPAGTPPGPGGPGGGQPTPQYNPNEKGGQAIGPGGNVADEGTRVNE